MERHEILEAMTELKLYGMRASFDAGLVRELATGAFIDAKRNAICNSVLVRRGLPTSLPGEHPLQTCNRAR